MAEKSAPTKYIFVTGGVASSLGKGIISSSIARLLQARGYSVTIQKLDPYINVDPGTLNPYEHGECYVTEDGAETDLDLGTLRAFHLDNHLEGQQRHHRQDLPDGHQQGTPRRFPRQDGTGRTAHHRRNQTPHQTAGQQEGVRRGHHRGGRYGRRHRVASLYRGGTPAAIRTRPAELGRGAPDARTLHVRFG